VVFPPSAAVGSSWKAAVDGHAGVRVGGVRVGGALVDDVAAQRSDGDPCGRCGQLESDVRDSKVEDGLEPLARVVENGSCHAVRMPGCSRGCCR